MYEKNLSFYVAQIKPVYSSLGFTLIELLVVIAIIGLSGNANASCISAASGRNCYDLVP